MDIGFIGVGNMGLAWRTICSRPAILSRSMTFGRDAAGPLLEKGARWAETPQQVAMQSEITFTSLPGLLMWRPWRWARRDFWRAFKPGSVYIDLSSNSPTWCDGCTTSFVSAACICLDAPVSGGVIGHVRACWP